MKIEHNGAVITLNDKEKINGVINIVLGSTKVTERKPSTETLTRLKRKKRNYRRFTKQEDVQILQLDAFGYVHSIIAKRVNRSQASVQARLKTLKKRAKEGKAI